MEREMKAMEKAVQEINVPLLGHTPVQREDGVMRVLACQMGGCASPEVREFKFAAVERLINKYNISLCVFVELHYNWSKENLSANLASWFQNEEMEVRSVTAHNTTEEDKLLSKHQLGGT